MPSTPKAIDVFKASGGAYFPAKAANAGGVAVSGLEMAQNSCRYFWTREEVDQKLQRIMSDIWKQSSETAKVKRTQKTSNLLFFFRNLVNPVIIN